MRLILELSSTYSRRKCGIWVMCNPYSITTNQAAIIALFRVVNRYFGNLAPITGVFPDYPAPVIRNTDTGTEMTLMRSGMPPPPRTGGPPVTNIRNTSSPHWRGWLKPENRPLTPANRRRTRGNPTRIAACPCRIAPSADGARSREILAPRRRRKTAPRPGVLRQAASGIGRCRVRAASSAAFPTVARGHLPLVSALSA